MIVVIADDISGAAEIAAVALQFGLKAQVQTSFNPNSSADVVAIDTDTRSLPQDQSRETLYQLGQSLTKTPMKWCYKKVDSVLRGHVYTECMALMQGLSKERTLLIPANPSKGRTVEQGHYLVQGQPLDQTEFALDPEHPAQTSDVAALIQGPIHLANLNEPTPPQQGITVANTQTPQDIEAWATQVDDATIPAGAVDFFTALMERRYVRASTKLTKTPSIPSGKRMIVCGSTSPRSHNDIKRAQEQGWTVRPMPELLAQAPHQAEESLIQDWAADIVSALSQHGRVITHIPGPIRSESALALRILTARMVQEVEQQISVTEWVIEGGATGRAILDQLSWHTLNIQGLYAPGVVQMQVDGHSDTWVTLKPGSYPWPQGWLES